MALLTKEGLDRLIALLVNEGLVDANEVARIQKEVETTKRPLVETLMSQGLATDEMMPMRQPQ